MVVLKNAVISLQAIAKAEKTVADEAVVDAAVQEPKRTIVDDVHMPQQIQGQIFINDPSQRELNECSLNFMSQPCSATLRDCPEATIPITFLSLISALYDDDSHVFVYFMLAMLICAFGYIVFHNKRKVRD